MWTCLPSSKRLWSGMLIIFAVVGGLADTDARGAIRFNGRSNRSGRPSYRAARPNPLAGAAAAVQRASAALNAARAEQATARRNLVNANAAAKARYDNSAALEPVREEYKKSEAAHDAAQDEVRSRLRQNNSKYQVALARLKDLETRLKSSSDSELKAEARQLRLDISSIESAAFRQDAAVQAAEKLRDAAGARIQTLRRDSEKSVAQDSGLKQAKSNAAKTASKVQLASANYGRTVASANAAAAAQSMRPQVYGSGRYGRGSRGSGHRPSSRFRRYR